METVHRNIHLPNSYTTEENVFPFCTAHYGHINPQGGMEPHEPLPGLNHSNLNFQILKDIMISRSLAKCLEEGKGREERIESRCLVTFLPTAREMLCVKEAGENRPRSTFHSVTFSGGTVLGIVQPLCFKFSNSPNHHYSSNPFHVLWCNG